MKMDCIKDFINSWKQYDKEPSDPTRSYTNPQWHHRFRDAGYFCVHPAVDNLSKWPKMHEWCQEQFGRDHYAWTGSTFWFENEQDAVLFTLKWS